MRIRSIAVLLSLVAMLLGAGAAQAAESWVTDPKTGTKIGWVHEVMKLTAATWSGSAADGKAEGKGTLVATVGAGKSSQTLHIQGEMLAGLLHGKAMVKWPDGDVFEGTFVNGTAEGKGVLRYASRGGRVYEGEYKNNLAEGFGVYKEANGKVIYEGEWRAGAPATRPLPDKVLGIAWGAAEDEVKKAMLERPKTTLQWAGKEGPASVQRYWGPFNNDDQWIMAGFMDGRLFSLEIVRPVPEAKLDEAMEKFEVMRKGLTERYGPADEEKGKYLDTALSWYWPLKYAVRLKVDRAAGASPPMFWLRLTYLEFGGYLKYEEKLPAAAKGEY